MSSQGASSALTIISVNDAFAVELAGLLGPSSGQPQHHQRQWNSAHLKEAGVFCTVIYNVLLGRKRIAVVHWLLKIFSLLKEA